MTILAQIGAMDYILVPGSLIFLLAAGVWSAFEFRNERRGR